MTLNMGYILAESMHSKESNTAFERWDVFAVQLLEKNTHIFLKISNMLLNNIGTKALEMCQDSSKNPVDNTGGK